MKLSEAIEILTHYQVYGEAPCPPALDDALKLGIEAMKAIRDIRLLHPTYTIGQIPGETEE